MAVSQAQIVDLLYKEAFGVTKTDTATNKSPSNESIPSPLLIRGDTQWTQSDQIPDIAAAVTDLVQAYTGANAVQCVADNTTVPIGGIYPTWKTNLTYWIPAEFGATYSVKVWVDNPGVANPTSTGTQIFADGSGGNGQFYYNYQSGVLNFIGETIPAALTSGKVLYVVGYRYIGLVGVTNLPSNTNIGNLNVTGSTIISTNSDGNIILTPDGNGIVQISSSLTSNANITASFFIGNGSQLSGVAASNAVSAGTVTDSAQPNITSVGTLISLDVAGNLTAGNADLGNLAIANFFSGDGSLLSNITGSNVVGNVTSAITANFANYAGNVTISAQPNITSVGTLISLDISGNLTSNNADLGNLAIANFFSGDGGLLTNIAAGNSVTSGTVTDSAQPNITSVGTLISLDVAGNLTAGNADLGNLAIANFFSGDGYLLSNITGTNIVGNVTSAVTANFANYAGNVTVASQPNITSVGTLTGLDVAGLSNLGPISNVTITGGSNNYFLKTDGSGVLSWASVPTGTGISNGTSNIDIYTTDGNINMSVNGNANIVTVTDIGANINGVLNVTGNLISANANLGNAVHASYFIGSAANLFDIPASNISGQVANSNIASTVYTNAQPNITSVGTLTSLAVTGNITGGNADLGNAVTANYFLGNGSLLTGIATATTAAAVANGTSNVNIPLINGNINLSASGNANILVVSGVGVLVNGDSNVNGNLTTNNIVTGGGSGGSITGANLLSANYVSGTLTTAAQPNITSVGTLTSLDITGNLSASNANLGNAVVANYFTGNFYGTANSATTATTAGTVTTAAQPNITSVGTLTSLDVSGHLIANTFQMGYDVYAFYSTSVYFATTASTSNNQVLWSYPAADLSAIDFTIIATDSVGATRQSCKISAAILGTSVAYNEYGGLFINGGVGSFGVVYNGSGPTPTLDLVVTPDSSNLTEYNMLISKYLV